MYKGASRQITYFLLLWNAGLSVFTFVIVQNLNDVFLRRIPSPRGVETKMKVQWILLFIVTFFYGSFHSPLVVMNWNKLLEMNVAVSATVVIFILQTAKLFTIYSMHPDLFGMKHLKDLETYAERLEADRQHQEDL